MGNSESSDAVTSKSRKLGVLAWTAIVACVALASSVAALVFELWPGLRPDPRTRLGADVAVFTVDPNVTFEDHLGRISFTKAQLNERLEKACKSAKSCGLLKLHGDEVYVRTTVEGFKRRSISMRIALYSATSRTRVEGASDVDVATEKLSSPSDRAVVPVWTPCPPAEGKRYFVRVELYHRGDDLLLAVADSKPFKARCRASMHLSARSRPATRAVWTPTSTASPSNSQAGQNWPRSPPNQSSRGRRPRSER